MDRTRLQRALPIAGAALVVAALALLFEPEWSSSATAVAPSVTNAPAISGTAAKGKTLTATSGSWSGSSPITFAYRWLRCNSSGGSCGDISGATSSTYTVVSSDVGRRLRVRVTATNADGAASSLSEATAVVVDGSVPANTVEPQISGAAVEGVTLSTTSGTWTGATPISFAYRWVRCGTDGGAADGSNCSSIGGATSSTYKLDSGDIGRRLRVRVTATNSAGSKTVASNPTAVVRASTTSGKPVSTAEPAVSGTASAGQTLSTTNGSWNGEQPITFTYQWVRCGTDGGRSDGSNCSSIRGATAATYKLDSGDIGRRLRARVTARNRLGSTTVASNPTNVVTAGAPPGTITLPSGERSIPVTSVPSDQRLVVDAIVFSPNPVRSRTTPIVVRIRVKDTRGYVVRDARVFIRSTPLVTSGGDGHATATDGWLSYELVPRSTFPVPQNGFNVQFFVKAYRVGDPKLAGVSGTRLVQVRLAG